MKTQRDIKELVATTQSGEGNNQKTTWTRIGIAVERTDGNWAIFLDAAPTACGITFLLRPLLKA